MTRKIKYFLLNQNLGVFVPWGFKKDIQKITIPGKRAAQAQNGDDGCEILCSNFYINWFDYKIGPVCLGETYRAGDSPA